MIDTGIDTICALSTVQGRGAIAVIRVSGPEAISIADSVFVPKKGISLKDTSANRVRFGGLYNDQRLIDEVLVSIFRSPHSYTGEDLVEISCHGSQYIQQEILVLLLSRGARFAKPGEFSQRAFLNGKLDLAQAEAVADLISSETEASHRIALNQMKGGFSKELSVMRQSMLEIVSLLELELDFGEEDVEFADRVKLGELLNSVTSHIDKLIDSFKLGNVIKNGIPVAIAGATNTGKSTLLNSLLGEDRAIVSEIHGTTRDFIEGFINIEGIGFRFIDTAGIRETREKIEIIGIERSYEKIKSASVIILLLDSERPEYFELGIKQLSTVIDRDNQKIIILLNKIDQLNKASVIDNLISDVTHICNKYKIEPVDTLPISAKALIGLDKLKMSLLVCREYSCESISSSLVTNVRHYEALKDARLALNRAESALTDKVPTDLLSQDIREALFHIGEIVGEINTEEILGNIFSRFCIGK
ncbi:MAG: tRNA uridine-5-carboxymethylaminomethyl(34) synthesis GTPase MnmE [Bacteroidales bacterium]|nr:tRNA uridine-5-carboxymethylaminomethyl(34) synthesis GTPase MnmE [Bacteroidales bacterium]